MAMATSYRAFFGFWTKQENRIDCGWRLAGIGLGQFESARRLAMPSSGTLSAMFVTARGQRGEPGRMASATTRCSATDRRTTRHLGYALNQTMRKHIEERSGWGKTVGCGASISTSSPP
jgi:hypothetical protein